MSSQYWLSSGSTSLGSLKWPTWAGLFGFDRRGLGTSKQSVSWRPRRDAIRCRSSACRRPPRGFRARLLKRQVNRARRCRER
jgi:hypothetical protein